MRDLATAMHEAAHLTVGIALGLRPKRAVLEYQPGWTWGGGVWFDGRSGAIEAWALMYAAGVAWERQARGHIRNASGDLRRLREVHVHTRTCLRALEIAAGAILYTYGGRHARLTQALIDRDLTGVELARVARGGRLGAEE